MGQPHDLFFKQIFSYREHAVDFLKFALPEQLAQEIDYSSISPEKTSHVDSSLSAYFSDTVYSCRMNDKKIKIAFLFEHKSSRDYNLTFQLLRYIVNLWENATKLKKPPEPVVPIVLYHGKESWNPGTLKSQFENLPKTLEPFIPDFQYVFIDLSAYSDEAIKQSIFFSASLKVAMLIMKKSFRSEELEKHLIDILEIGSLYFQEKKGLNFLKAVINYLFKATEIEHQKLIKAFTKVSEKGEEIAMTTAEKLRMEGHKEGLQQGIQQGIQKGIQKGIQQGIQKGFIEGMPKGKFYMMIDTIRSANENGLSEDVIAKIVKLDVGSVRKVINNETIDIPLHLLQK